MRSISVVINARTQSSRVPRKLVRPFAGRTLLDIALEKLNRMDFFEHRYLAVAEDALKAMAAPYPNVEILHRDAAAVQKGVNPQNVTFAHYFQVPSDFVFVMNPCLPCLSVDTIRGARDYVERTNYTAYTAVIPTGEWIFDPDGNPVTNTNPKDLTTNKNRSFQKATHAFYAISKRRYAETGLMWSFTRDDPHLVTMPEDEAVDVDTEIEFELAERVWQRRNAEQAK